MGWKDILYKAGFEAESHFDVLKLKFREKLGLLGNISIVSYISWCNHKELFVKGRVLENRTGSMNHEDNDSLWDNLTNSYRRFSSNEIAGAKLRITFSNTSHEVISDGDGYFHCTIVLNSALPAEELWHHPVIELLEAPVPYTPPVMNRCRVMTPPNTAQFGIISDIDDTILKTNATSLLKAAYLTFLGNAKTRMPFEGVDAFYTALQKGSSNVNFNPIFYVSSSPWNLYDFLVEFMDINKIPAGPLLLKDYGFSDGKLFTEGHLEHKSKAIKTVLSAYPNMQFILIGDSGQQDPEIYSAIVKEFPGRIAAIYIRDVSIDERDIAVKKISESLLEHKVEMVFAPDSYAAAIHASSKGFIHQHSLPLIKAAKKKDENGKIESIVEDEVKAKITGNP